METDGVIRNSIRILPVLVLLYLTACNLSAVKDGEREERGLVNVIVCQSDSIQILWDPPSNSGYGGNVVYYELFYRIHGDIGWKLLEREIGISDLPGLYLRHESLGNGDFDFAVRSVSDNGNKSELHSSLDSTANPSSGWYLRWNVD